MYWLYNAFLISLKCEASSTILVFMMLLTYLMKVCYTFMIPPQFHSVFVDDLIRFLSGSIDYMIMGTVLLMLP